MNEDLTEIQQLIPAYAGQSDVSARERSDQQTRALVGEALAALRERLAPDGITERLDELIERCQFGVAAVVNALEESQLGRPENAGLIATAHRDLVVFAQRAAQVGASEVAALLDQLAAAFDRHDALILKLAGLDPRPGRS